MQSKKIAITGGIGSGKSTISKIISKYGHKVFSCDEIYSLLLEGDLTNKIAGTFKGVVDENGLNRKKLSEIVFSDSEKLKVLTKLTNTEVIKYALAEMDKTEGLSFCEVPLLFENGFEELFDGVIVVYRDLQKRINSVIMRDKLSEEEVISRINNQFNYDNCDFAKYYVIHNNYNLEYLEKATARILNEIKNN